MPVNNKKTIEVELRPRKESILYKVRRFIVTMDVHVDIHSPFYDSNVTVYVTWFARKKVELENFKAPLDIAYQADIPYIVSKVPADVVKVTYPEGWDERVQELLLEERREALKMVIDALLDEEGIEE